MQRSLKRALGGLFSRGGVLLGGAPFGVLALGLAGLAACAPASVVTLEGSSDTAGAVAVSIEPHSVGGGERLLVACAVAVDGQVVRRVALLGAPAAGQRYIVQTGSTVEPTGAGLLARGFVLVDVEGSGGRTLTASVEVTFDGDTAAAAVVDQRFYWSSRPRLLDADAVFLLPKDPDERPARVDTHPSLEELDRDPKGFFGELLNQQPGLLEAL